MSDSHQDSSLKTVLIVSYFFPPFSSGSTIRIHNFVKYFPTFGIRPLVLTVREDYYPSGFRNDALLDDYAECVDIVRCDSLEPKAGALRDKVYGTKERKSLDKILIAFLKRIVNLIFIPDRNVLWTPYAVRAGLKNARTRNAEAVLATGPPFTAHLVAYLIAKRARLPLILDVRDDWIGNEYYDSGNALRRWLERKLEKRIVKKATRVVCATPESVALYHKKYPELDKETFSHISNGFDPALFEGLTHSTTQATIEFIHTGSLPPSRSPEFFVRAVRGLIDEHPELASVIRVRFIGYVPIEHQELVQELNLTEQFEFVSNVAQEEVARILVEEASVCLIFQRRVDGGMTAIPGKLYEYFAARKPILCMTDGGSTPNLLRRLGVDLITDYDDVEQIKDSIRSIVLDYAVVAASFDWPDETLSQFSRREHTNRLSEILRIAIHDRNVQKH